MTYSWGVPDLDALTGGIESTLMCVYGDTASGKTTLAGYQSISRIVEKKINSGEEIPPEAKFYFIDGDGGFDFGRAAEIWASQGLNPDKVREHIVYREVTEFDEQHKLIKGLPGLIEENQDVPLLLVVDPLTAIYRGQLLRTPMGKRASVIGMLTGKLDLQVQTLRHLAVVYKCPAIITTWSSSPIGGAMRESMIRSLMKEESITREQAGRMVPKQELPFLGGRMIGYLAKLIVGLNIPREGEPMREAYLFKARGRKSGGRCFFYLSDEGISPRR